MEQYCYGWRRRAVTLSMCARIFDEGILLELRFRVAERGQGVAILERSRPNTYVLVKKTFFGVKIPEDEEM